MVTLSFPFGFQQPLLLDLPGDKLCKNTLILCYKAPSLQNPEEAQFLTL